MVLFGQLFMVPMWASTDSGSSPWLSQGEVIICSYGQCVMNRLEQPSSCLGASAGCFRT